MLQLSPAFPLAFAALLGAAGVLYRMSVQHRGPFRWPAPGLAVVPVPARKGKARV